MLCSFIQGRDGTKRPFKNQRRMDQTGSSDEGGRNVISVIDRRRAVIIPGFKEVYIELQKMGMILTINTNGTLINEEWADFFQKYKPRRMNITLYGADDQAYEQLCHYPGGFQKTVNAVRLLRDREIDVKINGSITSKNEEDIRKILDIADDLDAAVNIDTYMYPASRERNKPFDEQSRMNPKDAAMAKKLIFNINGVKKLLENIRIM